VLAQDRQLLIGFALGDGCLHREPKWGSVSIRIGRAARYEDYAAWQLTEVNRILGTKANMRHFLAKGKYPFVEFAAGNKRELTPLYEFLYPSGVKTFTPKVLELMSLRELALLWMDDGSLEVRKRKRPRSIKVERSAWLAICEDEIQTELVGDWIKSLTGAIHTKVKHSKSGKYYLRWHSAQCKKLITAVEPYCFPSLRYKVDLSRTVSVKEWLSESQLSFGKVDDKTARAPRTLLGNTKGDDMI
jgi:hypothetical protein